ncbi:MAG: hypothetical protein ACR2K2_12350 [Mycobacteriales bacterium]
MTVASFQAAVDADRVSAGPLGLLVVLLMVIATVFLIRNMNGRIKRLPPEFPPPGNNDEPPPPPSGVGG